MKLSRLRETLEMVCAIDAFPSLDDSLETSRSAGLVFSSAQTPFATNLQSELFRLALPGRMPSVSFRVSVERGSDFKFVLARGPLSRGGCAWLRVDECVLPCNQA